MEYEKKDIKDSRGSPQVWNSWKNVSPGRKPEVQGKTPVLEEQYRRWYTEDKGLEMGIRLKQGQLIVFY